MSRARSTKRRKEKGGSRAASRRKTSNIVVFKVVDPIVQSGLIIGFVYSLVSGGVFYDFSASTYLYCLFALQILSLGMHFFFRNVELLMKERIFFLFAILPFIFCYRYITNTYIANGVEKYISFWTGNSIPIYGGALNTVAVLLGFWYNMICFRELKSLMKTMDDEE